MNVNERITVLEVNQKNIRNQLDKLDKDLIQIKYVLYAMLLSYLGINVTEFARLFF